MQTLIVHIEHDPSDISREELEKRIDAALPDPERNDVQDIGWRYFSSLGEAEAWESGEEDQS